MLVVVVTYDHGKKLTAHNPHTNPQALIDAVKLVFPTWSEIELTLVNTKPREQGNG